MIQPSILIEKQGKVGRIVLNRPEALHALTLSMCRRMTTALINWIDDDDVECVTVEHLGGTRGFCAGGDVAMLARSGKSDGCDARAFFWHEYRLNDLIDRYPKPYIAIMDGIVMGGGVGLSIHGEYQIATENTIFAMPETGIGLFPDVGATWFLPRLSGELGTWLALTGERLKGRDVVAARAASHFCCSAKLDDLKRDLVEKGISALAHVPTVFDLSIGDRISEMDELFQGCCVLQILARLKKGSEWARAQATKLSAKSPLSSKIALRQMRTGRYLGSLRDALKLEYRIASQLIHTKNFHEGVRAALIDKDHCPRWQPSSFRGTSFDEVSKYFSPIGDRELRFLEI